MSNTFQTYTKLQLDAKINPSLIEKAIVEVKQYEDQMLPRGVTERALTGVDLPDTQLWKIATDEQLANVSYIEINAETDEVTYVGRKIPSVRSLLLTHVPRNPRTMQSRFRYRETYPGEWRLRDEFKVPVLRDIALSLPFTHLDIARIIEIPAGGFLPVSQETSDDTSYDRGYGEITVVLQDGGVQIQYKDSDGEVKQANDNCYMLKSNSPWGIPIVKTQYTALRVFGKIDRDLFDAMG